MTLETHRFYHITAELVASQQHATAPAKRYSVHLHVIAQMNNTTATIREQWIDQESDLDASGIVFSAAIAVSPTLQFNVNNGTAFTINCAAKLSWTEVYNST
jgi:hypothetical protein